MNWFRRRQNRNVQLRIDLPSPGAPIELDDEELERASKTALGSAMASIEAKGRVFVGETGEQLQDYSMCEGMANLLALARTRLNHRNFVGAASTCVKVIGLAGTLHNPDAFAVQEAWLLLAEVHAVHGDSVRAQSLLAIANEKAAEEMARLRSQGESSKEILEDFRSDWESRSRKVFRLIR